MTKEKKRGISRHPGLMGDVQEGAVFAGSFSKKEGHAFR